MAADADTTRKQLNSLARLSASRRLTSNSRSLLLDGGTTGSGNRNIIPEWLRASTEIVIAILHNVGPTGVPAWIFDGCCNNPNMFKVLKEREFLKQAGINDFSKVRRCHILPMATGWAFITGILFACRCAGCASRRRESFVV